MQLAVRHVRHVRMSGDNNNRMERLNEEIREGKVMLTLIQIAARKKTANPRRTTLSDSFTLRLPDVDGLILGENEGT